MTAITPDPETLEAAVEAAARGWFESVPTAPPYDEMAEGVKERARETVRPGIAAAYPLIAAHHEAKALREAADGLEGSKGVCGFPQNPYEFRRWLRNRADSIGGDS